MSAQLPLPFSDWQQPTVRHAELLRLANAAEEVDGWSAFADYMPWRARWKRVYFYPWKDEFLRRFAVPDGMDLQILKLACHGCDGTGIWHSECGWHSDRCNRCWGTGVFRRDAVWLSRWNLHGLTFHIPEDREREVGPDWILEKQAVARSVISGLVKHAKVDPAAGRRAFLRLLWIYDRGECFRMAEMIADEGMRELQRRVASPFKNAINEAWWWLRSSEGRIAADLREWFGVAGPDNDVPF